MAGGVDEGRLVERDVFGVAMGEECRRELSAETMDKRDFSTVQNGRMRVKSLQTLCSNDIWIIGKYDFGCSDAILRQYDVISFNGALETSNSPSFCRGKRKKKA